MTYPYYITDRSVAHAKLVGGSSSHKADGTMTFMDGQTPATDAEIDAEIVRLKKVWDDAAYARNRKVEYPSRGDQFDMIYKDMLNSTTTHKDAVEAVKTKWPKDNSGPIE